MTRVRFTTIITFLRYWTDKGERGESVPDARSQVTWVSTINTRSSISIKYKSKSRLETPKRGDMMFERWWPTVTLADLLAFIVFGVFL
jgi:hypothetical protein